MSIEIPEYKAAELVAESFAPVLPSRQVTQAATKVPNRWLQAIPLLIVLAAFAMAGLAASAWRRR